MNMFRVWLPDDITKRIVNIPPPQPLTRLDKIAWGRSVSRAFSVKSAHRMLREGSWNSKDDTWRMVWKFSRLQRVCVMT